MKARIESGSDTVYVNASFEKANSPTKSTKTKKDPDHHNKLELVDNAGKQTNGFKTRNVSVSQSRYDQAAVPSDDFRFRNRKHVEPPEQRLEPLHFDTQEVLEETPAIFKSLTSGTRGPDTFVYVSSSSSKPLSQNEEDPFKTFVISSETNAFVNRKNSLNQSSAANGFRNKINSNNRTTEDNNEYLSYVIDKGPNVVDAETMSEQKANGKGGAGSVANGVASENVPDECEFSRRNGSNGRPNGEESEIRDGTSQVRNGSDETGVLSFDKTIADKKEQAFAKLQDELQKAHKELLLRDEEVARLTRIREDVERELEELTASLFQEAHRMVGKAKEKQAAAEKSLAESQMKMDVLSAEVVALKTLVLTSTPSRPNPHLHPQIGKDDYLGGVNLFNRKHRRSPSHFNLKYGRENSPPDSPVKDTNAISNTTVSSAIENRDISEVDPTIHKEFLNWSLTCKLDKTDPFIDRIYREDINLCLDFSNRELAENVQKAIETRDIFIEAVTDKSKSMFPRKCALLEVTRQCHYRMKLGDQDVWYNISQMCRNRIIAVCDFINYLRYIELGLVKSSAHDMYWEIMRLRKEMILARLGLSSPAC